MTVMINMAMNFLQQYCKATIVLSSATQPCFEELKWPLHFSEKTDLVRLEPESFNVYHHRGPDGCCNGIIIFWDMDIVMRLP